MPLQMGSDDGEEQDEKHSEALILADIETLACRISVGAILRPQCDDLLKGFEKRMIGYESSLRELAATSSTLLARIAALRSHAWGVPQMPSAGVKGGEGSGKLKA
ncbi:hypothetical protein NGA_0115202 [Nannochloropsis gaditana CCMP526]|uniref:uncharacterized protein n=1 Tax=Nannochloropsis gaditana (strain CCMP526) TaxID=1093141 RepID=UPI00029F77B7|nr:hypothetical protein NGA_0115202 [Nannochloropsis gaditana CCMP526]XP_005855411.1 hypothetical protein NGA_0115201 [Nannochloropsis gaditana CCMP526]EKU20942.1 hypothetical protein NGA_0115201 [Nannochloropsis gaditana CCMP526]EKU23188.1 hypothetical protein NGA_0115202 [Nannochloropsis gaditana CCMP526]|eukprot:XP_005852643.1 hypothetical protein NGA_0115202 [Nannochloropsis gaditana CCMP526]